MVFISSTIPFNELKKFEEPYPDLWFLFTCNVENKNYKSKWNAGLTSMYRRMILYKEFYTKLPLYCYLMTDKYYYKSNLFKHNPDLVEVVCMKKIPFSFLEMQRHLGKYKPIENEKQVLSEEDINYVFETFINNNFKENPICEVVLKKKDNSCVR